MKIYDVDIIKLLPYFMQKDDFNIFFAKYLSEIIKSSSQNLNKLSVWNTIDSLDDEECDLFAWELNINFYSKYYSLDKKRTMLKTGLKTKMSACTKSALEQVLKEYSNYGGEFNIIEWYDSDNISFNHYKLELVNPGVYDISDILKILNSINRKSAILDGFDVKVNKSVNINVGTCVIKSSAKTFDMRTAADFTYFTYDGKYCTDENGNILIEG